MVNSHLDSASNIPNEPPISGHSVDRVGEPLIMVSLLQMMTFALSALVISQS